MHSDYIKFELPLIPLTQPIPTANSVRTWNVRPQAMLGFAVPRFVSSSSNYDDGCIVLRVVFSASQSAVHVHAPVGHAPLQSGPIPAHGLALMWPAHKRTRASPFPAVR
jgi:hypothetical protein